MHSLYFFFFVQIKAYICSEKEMYSSNFKIFALEKNNNSEARVTINNYVKN